MKFVFPRITNKKQIWPMHDFKVGDWVISNYMFGTNKIGQIISTDENECNGGFKIKLLEPYFMRTGQSSNRLEGWVYEEIIYSIGTLWYASIRVISKLSQ